MEREYKALDAQIQLDAETGVFEGYAAVFGNIDRVGDRIEAGAFVNLEELTARGALLWQHDPREVVGMIERAEQDAYGLRVVGKFHSTPRAQEVRQVIAERAALGKPTPMSIGYRPLDWRYETSAETGEVRVLTAIEVFEVSFVVAGANPLAAGTAKRLPAPEPKADLSPAFQRECVALTLLMEGTR